MGWTGFVVGFGKVGRSAKIRGGTVCSGTGWRVFRYRSGSLFRPEPPYLLLFSPYRNIGTVKGVKEGE